MIDHSAIQRNDSARAQLAAQMAAWEAEHGPVETLPIHTEDKKPAFRITCPEKKAAQQKASQASAKAERSRNAERIGAMLRLGVKVPTIAERTGLAQRSVRRIIKEERLTA
ncbi:hypothetical protein DN824_21945 [Stutzerimonas nosocomialis]|uniref:hypothetical protein n=1 Tax=Stutzerimonas nosocomialis TaxID=1056496 RepID=UPI0011099489|nr:hypothetical protein [Stutzerimonas nosocomialis]TLX52773.1 hypothetical protein DN824_21945 [Stutzerimonas nosocomialis]